MSEQDQELDLGKDESKEGEESDTSKDNHNIQDRKQSNKGLSEEEEAGSSKTYKTLDGRELSPDDMYKEYDQLSREFTRRSQQLRDYEKKISQYDGEAKIRETKAAEDARQAVSENDILKGVDPSVKEAIIKIVEPVLENRFKMLDKRRAQEEADMAFEKELTGLESKYKDFNREEVLRKMQEPGNRVFDPEVIYLRLHEPERLDALVKDALKKQRGGIETENTGGGPKKPESKTPKSFEEAARAFADRLKNQ